MGGKSSKQKIKKSKEETGDKTGDKKEEKKEGVENGETATEKTASNQTTAVGDGDTSTPKSVEKTNSAVTDSEAKGQDIGTANEIPKEPPHTEAVAESLTLSSETMPVENKPITAQSSPQPLQENKAQTPDEDSADKEERSDEVTKEEEKDKLEDTSPTQECSHSQEVGEVTTEVGLTTSHIEKTQAKDEESIIPVTSSHTAEADVAAAPIEDCAVEGGETTVADEPVKSDENGEENNVLLEQSAS